MISKLPSTKHLANNFFVKINNNKKLEEKMALNLKVRN
jgi:hypothetical protein